MAGAGESSPELLARVRREIREAGPLPFSRFMELALYDAEHGYYASGAGVPGPEGDFVTASDAGRWFGICLARQLRELDDRLGRPDTFRYVEFGAGRGLLARDVVDALPGAAPGLEGRLHVTLVDRSPAMRVLAGENVPEARVVAPARVVAGGAGCAVAVELFDALPVHRVRRRGGRLREIYVGVDAAGDLVECEGPPTAAAETLAARYGAAGREGEEAEVAAGVPEVVERIASRLERGFLLVVDYGDAADRLYGPARPRGTLLAYHRHRANEEPLRRVGRQDLTAHVNFTAVEDAARDLGLDVLGCTTQDRFLLANGIAGAFRQAGEAEARDPRRVRERLQAVQLIHPHAMGRRFRVLLCAKRVDLSRPLRGLEDPFRRGPD